MFSDTPLGFHFTLEVQSKCHSTLVFPTVFSCCPWTLLWYRIIGMDPLSQPIQIVEEFQAPKANKITKITLKMAVLNKVSSYSLKKFTYLHLSIGSLYWNTPQQDLRSEEDLLQVSGKSKSFYCSGNLSYIHRFSATLLPCLNFTPYLQGRQCNLSPHIWVIVRPIQILCSEQ